MLKLFEIAKKKKSKILPDYKEIDSNREQVNETASLVKSFAEKSGKSEAEVEKLWDEAKKSAEEQGHKEDYDYIVSILKNMLKLNESNITDIQEIREYVMYLINAVSQFHIYHLICKNGSHHEALKEYYLNLQKEVDEIVEHIIAYQGDEFIDNENDTYELDLVLNYDYDLVLEDTQYINDYTTEIISKINNDENKAVVEELTEIQEACSNLLYKLQLS